jgi:hypothetical protein
MVVLEFLFIYIAGKDRVGNTSFDLMVTITIIHAVRYSIDREDNEHEKHA